MANPYLPAASSISHRAVDRLYLLLMLGLLVLSTATRATAGDVVSTLRPYTAQYKTTARGFNLNVTRELKADANHNFVLTNGGRMLVVGFHELSVFKVEGEQIKPSSYIYQGTGLVNQRQEVHFKTDPAEINSLYKDKWYELPYAGVTLDRMNQLEQLRLLLMNDPATASDVTLRVADGKKVKESHLVLVAKEMLDTPLGPIATLHYQRLHDDADRKSDLWFAPQWDYLMVKTVHIDGGDPVEMVLTSAIIDGEPVAVN